MIGHLDPTLDHVVRGWAWDPARPYARVEVALSIDGKPWRKVIADRFRPDLLAAGIGDGAHGFAAELLPANLFDGEPHTIEAAGLHGSPLHFEAFLDGMVEQVKNNTAYGILRDRVHPQAQFDFALYADGVRVVAHGRTNEAHRFAVRLPGGFDPERVRAWTFQAPAPITLSPAVDIVVPVYAGIEDTERTLRSVLASKNTTPFELIAILDNPENAAMAAMLESLTPLGVTLLRNETNEGFVRTVNRGMRLHPDRDVVLLNADTAVHGDWLDRLRRAAYAQPHTGTVTPFSNNASICSYPRICAANPVTPGADALCRERLAGVTVEIPTAVGFCMYIRRECLAETGGYFDAHTFGRGYGEENDFCLRARRLGWRHVLAADTYVEHVGHVSFGGAGVSEENAAKLAALHPAYNTMVSDFLHRDPLRNLRRKLDKGRLARPVAQHVCVATNTLPGGNERYVQQQLAGLEEPVLLRYRQGRYVTLDASPNFEFDLLTETALLQEALASLGVSKLQVNQIVDAPLEIFALGIPYEITVHDYAWICPQVTLQDETGVYCGEPVNVARCESCFAKLGPHKDWGSLLQRRPALTVEGMRREHASILERAERVVFPSHDIARRMMRYVPGLRAVDVVPHDLVRPATAVVRGDGVTRRAAYIGSLGYAKGYRMLYALALDAYKRVLPLEFIVIGEPVDADPLRELGVRVTGYYQGEAEAREWIERERPDMALFPGSLPESFSYTLSTAFAAGLYPVSFDIGAIAERIREHGFGKLIPLDATVAEINGLLLSVTR